MSILPSSYSIIPIESSDLVARGGTVLIIGNAKSGKTCIFENMMQNSAGSFGKHNNFLPLYVGSRVSLAQRYFASGLFSDFVSPYAGERHSISMAHISQQGCAEEFDQATRERQGQRFAKHRCTTLQNTMPRIALYIDHCDYEEKFVRQCLMPTDADEIMRSIVNIVEVDDSPAIQEWSLHNLPYLGIIVFTSLLDIDRHQSVLKAVLGCSNAVVADLIHTANRFVQERNIALVIHLHQWRATKQLRGFHIYKYGLVPPLASALPIGDSKANRATAATLPRIQGNFNDQLCEMVDAFEPKSVTRNVSSAKVVSAATAICKSDTDPTGDAALKDTRQNPRLWRTIAPHRRRRTKHL